MADPALEAVLNVEELYNLSLARGLKVGLAKVAIEERTRSRAGAPVDARAHLRLERALGS